MQSFYTAVEGGRRPSTISPTPTPVIYLIFFPRPLPAFSFSLSSLILSENEQGIPPSVFFSPHPRSLSPHPNHSTACCAFAERKKRLLGFWYLQNSPFFPSASLKKIGRGKWDRYPPAPSSTSFLPSLPAPGFWGTRDECQRGPLLLEMGRGGGLIEVVCRCRRLRRLLLPDRGGRLPTPPFLHVHGFFFFASDFRPSSVLPLLSPRPAEPPTVYSCVVAVL